MLDPLVLLFFTKEATGADYMYLKARREMAKIKPDPIELDNPVQEMHLKHIKGLVRPRLATARPKMQGTKKIPLNLAGNPRERLGLKRNQS